MPLIEVKDLRTYFYTEDGVVKAVDGVTFGIEPEGTLGVVGESGCGKSVTALSIMGLVPMPPGKITSGQIIFRRNGQGIDLTKLNPKGKGYRSIRGKEIAMIFQEPMTSLNPVFTIGYQIMEAIMLHQKVSKKEARQKAIEMLRQVGIPLPEQRVDEYPHQLSGGMRQRAMIAMALSCNPSLLIADEPTTALDVTIQAQVLDLMRDLQKKFRTAIMLITHDLGVVAEMCEEVVVMYLGKVVEHAPVRPLYHDPKHPYTQGLLKSIPSLATKKERLEPIKGVVPDPLDAPPGCPFHPRCPHAMEICTREMPALKEVGQDHQAACWLY
ncbi:MAG: Peptide/nickel transport system ATP-binding protein [Acetothermia bacterium 64_32]|nr:MAG: Peptide/nickel transport system ATP-binding protein [Acetothermia bacterium 64_32]MBC7098836.1 ABC transporter ATP-binding protein [Candidatus Bipolaricaulota bacterium]HAF69821.1 peptide ABC transporter ATP-binding protein [Candidatus Acetothermia bacterium]